jgi:hypothetical protein
MDSVWIGNGIYSILRDVLTPTVSYGRILGLLDRSRYSFC